MSNTWPHTTHAKIHEGCGGYVRWVEAYDQPGVGYSGECLACGVERLPMEAIIPIRADPEQTGYQLVQDVDKDVLADLEWDDSDEFMENQKRLRRVIDS